MIGGLIARLRSLVRGIRKGDDLYTEMGDEFRAHIELRAEDLTRAGLAPGEALRQARLEFGSTEMHKDAGRASRGLRAFDAARVSWLDFKLGFRMLARYPGLTLVGGLAMAFAIWVGAGTFEVIGQVLRPKLPLPDAGRIVAVQLVDSRGNRMESRTLFDFARWRGRLRTVGDLGVFATRHQNLIIGQGGGEPAVVAGMSASGFRVAGIRPLLGRSLVDADEQPGAPPVIVLGHQLWTRRFDRDSSVLGRTVRLGRESYQIVGVMPEGFAWPVSHQAWVPFPIPPEGAAPRQGPTVRMFGTLAPGASREEANAELALLGQRTAADFPVTHERLRPRVLEYGKSFWNLPTSLSLGLLSSNLFVVMLLVLVCSNVALLMFARAATREAEIAVRTALGASRGRIVTQLFAEALVLGGMAAAIGLSFAGAGMRWALDLVKGEFLGELDLPFWFSGRLSPATLVYTLALTLLAAVIAGVLPALKITRGIGERLKQTSAAGRVTFGGIWTAVIITQVALTVAFPAVAFFVRRDSVRIQTLTVDFASGQFLSVRPGIDRDVGLVAADSSPQAYRARVDSTLRVLEQRLLAEPGVLGVTVTDLLPRSYHGWNEIEVDGGAVEPMDERGHRISSAAVDPDYFDVLETPVLSGRGFSPNDVGSAARPVIVNTEFVEKVLGGKNPLGRRIRYLRGESPRVPEEPPGPWYDIVGVVGDLGTKNGYGLSGVYHPREPKNADQSYFAIRVRGEPDGFIPRVRALATAVDPTLRLHELKALDRVLEDEIKFYAFWFRITLLVAGVTLVLSLAGVYAVMAFTVSRRTREIAIRVAMGAVPRQIIPVILRRPLRQVLVGVLAGGVLTWVLSTGTLRDGVWIRTALLAAGYSVLMLGVCLLACIVPTRRVLRVEPTEALRSD